MGCVYLYTVGNGKIDWDVAGSCSRDGNMTIWQWFYLFHCNGFIGICHVYCIKNQSDVSENGGWAP